MLTCHAPLELLQDYLYSFACRAARSEAEGWKARTMQAEAQIAELKLRETDYRAQLGLPLMEPEEAGAAPAALMWHKPESEAEQIGVLPSFWTSVRSSIQNMLDAS